ncbi:hypothetical protein BHUM_03581 [Candidatus Burkholderia humilis]|nr:hypothetical protein BHUM_03581 [Candidatus Burkholderia humilis]
MQREAFYELVDLIGITSMWDEPFGIVGIEPWKFLNSSVAFASGGLPEIYAELPELIVQRGDAQALGALIGRLASDSAFYAEMSRRCHIEHGRFMPREQIDEFERVSCRQRKMNRLLGVIPLSRIKQLKTMRGSFAKSGFKMRTGRVLMVMTRDIPETPTNGRERTLRFIRDAIGGDIELREIKLHSAFEVPGALPKLEALSRLCAAR